MPEGRREKKNKCWQEEEEEAIMVGHRIWNKGGE